MIGKTIAGRYEVIELLGTGGMARVFMAKDLNLGREVALKVLLDSVASDPEFKERFRREARASAALSHPKIVQVHDFFESPEGTFIVMELVRGEDLRSFMNRSGRLSIDRSIKIAIDILNALQVAHDKGLVHRDISARNVMLGRDGSVKVSDFGIARVVGECTLTQVGDLIGSVQYISPEQARGEEATPSADLYAVGVLLYEMLTGQLPYQADTVWKMALKHIQEPIPLPSKLRPEISSGLDAIVAKAMAKTPQERYASAYDMAKALNALKNQPVAAVPEKAANDEDELIAQTMVRRHIPAALIQAESIKDKYIPAGAPAEASEPEEIDEDGSEALSELEQESVEAVDPSLYDEDYGEEYPEELNDEGDETTKNSGRLVGILLAIFSVVFFAIVGGVTWISWGGENQVEVPQLKGRSSAEAKSMLEHVGLTLQITAQRNVPNVSPDTVLEQDPEAGARLGAGSVVRVVISSGKGVLIVPDVTGMSEQLARQELDGLGINYRIVLQESRDAANGTVFEQQPPAGSKIPPGTEIVIYINESSGVRAPDLTGMTEDKAREVLGDLGLKLEVSGLRSSAKVAKDTIMEQTPNAGAKMRRGQVLKIVVSSGPEAKAVAAPSFVGKSVSEARRIASEVGLEVTVEGGGVDNDKISRQQPAAGELCKNKQVTLYSFSMAVVPDVTGLSYNAAASKLREAGLKVGAVSSVHSNRPAGEIVSQTPGAGIEAEFGSSVSLSTAAAPQHQEAPVHRSQPASSSGNAAPAESPATDDTAPPLQTVPVNPGTSSEPADNSNFPIPGDL